MKNIPNIALDLREALPVEIVRAMLSDAVAAVEMDGTEDCTRVELKTLCMDLAGALYLESDEECVARIVGRPDLLTAVEAIRGSKIFSYKRERLAMVSAEIARREIEATLLDAYATTDTHVKSPAF